MRRRLVAVALATTTMVALAFLVPLAVLVGRIAHDDAVNDADRESRSLAPVLAVTLEPSTVTAAVGAGTAGREGRVTVFLADGTRIGGNTTATDLENVERARDGRPLTVGVAGGVDVLTPVALEAGTPVVIRVHVPDSLLRAGVGRARLVLVGVGATLVVIAVGLADRLARTTVAPIRDLAGAAQRLGAGDLEARVDPGGPPEVVDVGRAFNRLADRIDTLLVAERELVADLSHRLRTPLAALRLDAEAIADPDVAARVADDADELARVVSAVIDEARRPVRDGAGTISDADAVVRERVAFWAALAEDQGRSWTMTPARPGPRRPVAVNQGDLAAAIDALIGNVFAHTDEGVPFSVAVGADDSGRIIITVDDGGGGLPAHDVVGRGRSGSGSTGLGLDIARRTATAAGGRLVVGTSSTGGARIEMRLPSAGL